MLVLVGTLGLLSVFVVSAVGGGLLMRRRGKQRWFGLVILLEACAAIALQIALSTIPFGIGEPLIRVQFWTVLAQTGLAALTIALATGGIYAIMRLSRLPSFRLRRWRLPAATVVLPLIAATALYGFVRVTTPVRERERDPSRRQITLPQGFASSIFVQGTIDNPTTIVFGPDGKLYIGDISGVLWVASDADHDGRAEKISRFADGFSLLVGLAWHDGELFASSSGKIEALRDTNNDGIADQRRLVVRDLPSMVLKPHSNNGLAFGPDGRLYFGVGSTTAGQVEQNPLAASILSVKPDGSDLKVFARGLGNSFDVAFNADGQLFGGDNSPQGEQDASGAAADPPDEFNWLVEGGHYGFPYFYGDPPDNGGTRGALVTFPAHSVPTGVTFYGGKTYPQDYHDSGFVTLWGNGQIMRVEVGRGSSGNYLGHATPFATGFLYPIAVTTGPDGNLYIADFGTSAVYRITYDPNKAY